MDWEEDELSGHLRAIGNNGEYWVLDLDTVYLERVNPTPAAPDIEKLGTYETVEEATAEAEEWDR